jgi:hypothetical protein
MKTPHSLNSGQPMYSTAAKFPQAAAEFLHDDKQLAVLIQLVASRTLGFDGDSSQ